MSKYISWHFDCLFYCNIEVLCEYRHFPLTTSNPQPHPKLLCMKQEIKLGSEREWKSSHVYILFYWICRLEGMVIRKWFLSLAVGILEYDNVMSWCGDTGLEIYQLAPIFTGWQFHTPSLKDGHNICISHSVEFSLKEYFILTSTKN